MNDVALALDRVTVRYGDFVANRDVSVTVRAGSVHAVVGENGAGKSTLMKAAVGLVPLDAGEVRIAGARVERPSPAAAIARGVGMVHQHFMLVDTLTAAENVVLGDEPVRGVILDGKRAVAETEALAASYGLAVEARRPVRDLSVGEQQRIEILKVLRRLERAERDLPRTLILDEPTAVLTPPEVDALFVVLRRFASAGGAVVLVTHKLDEVVALAETVTVLRRGQVALEARVADTSTGELARAIVGHDLVAVGAVESRPPGAVRLEVADLRVAGRGGLDGVSLVVRAGEILGVAGVEGNGQTALAEAIAGLARTAGGRVALDGVDVTRASAGGRRARGLAHVPDDRHRRGLLLDRSLSDNLLLGREREYAWRGLGPIDRKRLHADVRRLLDEHDVRPADPSVPARALSGGNQQKLVFARELARSPSVMLAAQPTRGVDLGAARRIHDALRGLRTDGRAVLLLSAELDELLALSDRIVVLLRGRIVAEVPRADATRERLGRLMTGAAAA